MILTLDFKTLLATLKWHLSKSHSWLMGKPIWPGWGCAEPGVHLLRVTVGPWFQSGVLKRWRVGYSQIHSHVMWIGQIWTHKCEIHGSWRTSRNFEKKSVLYPHELSGDSHQLKVIPRSCYSKYQLIHHQERAAMGIIDSKKSAIDVHGVYMKWKILKKLQIERLQDIPPTGWWLH